jgi:hypothetical protein
LASNSSSTDPSNYSKTLDADVVQLGHKVTSGRLQAVLPIAPYGPSTFGTHPEPMLSKPARLIIPSEDSMILQLTSCHENVTPHM